MRNIIFAAAVLFCGSQAVAADAPSYDDLVARAEQGDTSVDFTALRSAYALSGHYDPYAMNTRDLFSAAWRAFQGKDCKTAVASARAMLKINYISIPMHFVVSDCLKETGDAGGAEREAAIARGLATSLLDSGDGKSIATAYKVVSLSEEGFVLSMLGFKEEQQSLLNNDGRQYDLLEGKDEATGEARSVYFNVDALFAGMARQLGEKPAGSGP